MQIQEIKVNPKEVRKAASELRNSMSLIKGKLSAFQDIENEIEASWRSRYTRQYLDCLEDTENQVRRTVGSVETVASNLDKIALSVEKAEREIQMLMARNSGSGRGGGGRGW